MGFEKKVLKLFTGMRRTSITMTEGHKYQDTQSPQFGSSAHSQSPSTPLHRLSTVKNHIYPSSITPKSPGVSSQQAAMPLATSQQNDVSPADRKFIGWMGFDQNSVRDGALKQQEFQPKPFSEDDVDIKITHCGICGTDVHVLNSAWGPTKYPVCVGHEIAGIAVNVGANVRHVKIGDRVGVGAQVGSCLRPDCEECALGNENYCSKLVGTYNSRYPDGSISYGGYANYIRVPGHFVFKFPDNLPSDVGAPLLCAGASVYSPLVQNGCGPSKRVGVIGIGGLGHLAIAFAKALGAEKVVAISRTSTKKADALKLGASEFIATDEDPNWDKSHSRTLDIIISTVSPTDMPVNQYLDLLRINGAFVQLGLADGDNTIPPVKAGLLAARGLNVSGSLIASPKEIRDMLELAAKKSVHAWVQRFPMSQVNDAIQKFDKGEARYRFVLVNEDAAYM